MDFSPINSNPNWHSNLKTSRLENPSPSLIPYKGVPGSPQLSFSISEKQIKVSFQGFQAGEIYTSSLVSICTLSVVDIFQCKI